MICQHCGQELDEGAVFCGFCGTACAPQTAATESQEVQTPSSDWQTYDVFAEERKSSSKKRTALLAVGWVWFGLAVAAWITVVTLWLLGILPPT